jgi:hypothetical protein
MHVEEHEPLERLRELTKQQKRVREHRRSRAEVLGGEDGAAGGPGVGVREAAGAGVGEALQRRRRRGAGGGPAHGARRVGSG